MKSRPILFSKDMVEAILQGRKTQTRRIIKDSFNGCWTNGGPHPCPNDPVVMHPGELIKDYEGQYHRYEAEVVEAWFHCSTMDKLAKCPYGKISDILYGREAFYAYGYWDKDILGNWTFFDLSDLNDIGWKYENDPPDSIMKKREFQVKGWFKRPSLFMPKKASRIWLQITDIRVERLMDILEKDAIAEGILRRESGAWQDYSPKFASFWCDPIKSYISLWNSINGKDAHKINPWVWVIEFENIGFEKAAMLLTHGEKA